MGPSSGCRQGSLGRVSGCRGPLSAGASCAASDFSATSAEERSLIGKVRSSTTQAPEPSSPPHPLGRAEANHGRDVVHGVLERRGLSHSAGRTRPRSRRTCRSAPTIFPESRLPHVVAVGDDAGRRGQSFFVPDSPHTSVLRDWDRGDVEPMDLAPRSDRRGRVGSPGGRRWPSH